MDWNAIGAIGEICGALAVVLTILYLARQVNVNSKQVELSSSMSMASLLQDAFTPIYNNKETMSVWSSGIEIPESLSPEDLRIFFLLMDRLMNCFETTIVHHDKNAIEEREFGRYASYMAALIQTAGGKQWLEAKTFPISDEARNHISLDQAFA